MTATSIDNITPPDSAGAPAGEGPSVVREPHGPAEYFAFAEDTRPSATGFGIASNPSVGGKFALLPQKEKTWL
jgi:hypothetical protein